MAKRINHKKLHEELENLGYEVYTCDYKHGTHTYQLEKENQFHEYRVIKQGDEKAIDLYGVDGEIKNLIKSYYKEQGIKIL